MELAGCRQGCPGGVYHGLEVFVVANRQVTEHLAIDLDIGQIQSVDQLAVGEASVARGGVDPRDPKPAHIATALAAVSVSIRQGLEHSLVSSLVQLAPGRALPFGQSKHLLMPFVGGDCLFYSSQLLLSVSNGYFEYGMSRRIRFSSLLSVGSILS